MRLRLLALLLAVSGCLSDAEAYRDPDRWGAKGRGGSQATGGESLGPLDRYTWDLVIDGSACPGTASSGLSHQISGTDAGPLAWGYGADAGTYTCNGSTSPLTNLGALADQAMVFAGGDNCWNLTSSLLPAILDGADLWCRIVFQTGDNTGNRYMISFGSSTSDFFAIYQNSTERNIGSARTGALTALTDQTAVLTPGTWYVLDRVYRGAAPTNPAWENYINGAATIGAEHTANLGGLAAGSRIAVGGQSSGQCSIGVPQLYTILSMRCAFGAGAAQFTGEAMHDADCTELGACP